jgi:phosphoglycerol transferase MdoB-like AlkP superfamily enzyme
MHDTESKIPEHKILKFAKSPFLIFTSFFGIIIIAYCVIIEISYYKFHQNLMTLPQLGNFIVWFLPEFLLFYCLGLLFCNKNKFFRSIFYIGFIVFLLIYLTQSASIHMTNDLISVLALENIHFIGLIIHKKSLLFSATAFILGIIVFIAVTELFTDKHIKLTKKMFISISSLSVILLAYLIFYNFFLLSVTDKIFSFFPNRQTPVVGLVCNAVKLKTEITETTIDINMFRKLGLNYNKNSKYPFMKEQIYSSPIKYSFKKNKPRPNIIVFFLEGISARSINCYGSEFKGLTPNIDSFAKAAMQVNNYYNHTAASCRGMQGQLCSIYPFHGYGEWSAKNNKKLEKMNYSSIPYMLNKFGYDTLFFCAENKPITQLFKMLKFKTVYNAKKITKELLNGQEKYVKEDILTDESFFKGFIEYLKKREKTNSKKPFFIGLYNIETHAYFKTPPNRVKYKNSDNDTLNSVHNLDLQFGKFYNYFKKSAYANNTIVILTTDHAHYFGDSHYRKTLRGDYQLLPVDKIPLLIYNPFLNLPKRYNAKMGTSIDLAPTLFHMLGINNVPNNFLGQSLFERTKDYGVSAIRHKFYFIYKNRIYMSKCPTDKLSKIFKVYTEYIKTSYLIESKNRIFSDKIDPKEYNKNTLKTPASKL